MTFHVPRWASTSADDVLEVALYDGGTQLQRMRTSNTIANISQGGGTLTWSGTPSSGSHTYKIMVCRPNGTGSLTMVGAATEPMQLIIIDVGPSS